MKREVKLKEILDVYLKNHKVLSPSMKMSIELSDFSFTVQYCLN